MTARVAPEPALVVEELEATGTGALRLGPVSFALARGDALAVLDLDGASGGLLLDALAGLVFAHGRIRLDGRDLAHLGPARRLCLGVVWAWGLPMPARASVADHLARAARHAARKPKAASPPWLPAELLRRLRLAHLAHRPVWSLALPALRRVELARCLLAAPRLVLWDRPFAGLSLEERAETVDLVRDITAKGVMMILLDRDGLSLGACCSLGLVLAGGRPLAQGPVAELADLDLDSRVLER